MTSLPPAASRDCEVAIIGSGFAGLCMAIKLRQAGIDDFVVFEKADGVGGVWRDNTYPGCACDVPSHLYSFSFEPNPDWSRMYPTQVELRAYLNHCADKYGISPRIRFQSEVTSAEFDPATGRWLIRDRSGEVARARALVNAAGALAKPALPDVPGLSSFAGAMFHSARWDHDYDLGGKRVAVIGTGASAIQFVPRIARKVRRVHLFQRTAPWIVGKFDPAFRPWQQRLFRKLPFLAWLMRVLIYWLHERAALNFIGKQRRRSPTERTALELLQQSIPDPELRQRLTPDYRVGCKRILLSNDYLPALNRDNVELVTSGIAEVRAHSIVTHDGVEREVDAVILGTGFKATEFVAPLEIYGLGGRELSAHWRDAAPSYLGIVASGFPNFFMITGPNTGLGHNSIIFMIEAQVHFILQCLAQLRRGVRYLDVHAGAQARFTADVQARMQRTVWLSGCKSWYLSPDGRNFTLWPGFTFQYWLRTRRLKLSDFQRVPGARDAGSHHAATTQATAR